jgi:hypothetical protein
VSDADNRRAAAPRERKPRKPPQFILKIADIPRIEERRLVDSLWNDFGALAQKAVKAGRETLAWPLLRAVWSNHLWGKCSNAHSLARQTGIPRNTLKRKLAKLLAQGKLVREGDEYGVAPAWLNRADSDAVLDKYIDRIVHTAHELERIRRKRQESN